MTPRAPRIAPFITVCLLFAAASGQAAFGQAAAGSLDWYDSQAKDAITASNFEAAVKLLTEAKAKFPKAPEVNLQLADLYYDKELFTLALDEYLLAEKK